MWASLMFSLLSLQLVSTQQPTLAQAVIYAANNGSNYTALGTLSLTQLNDTLYIQGKLSLPLGLGIPDLKDGDHGFHIHEYGNLTNGCLDAGGHYNPFGNNHGAPNATDRHVGDLGNVYARVGFKSSAGCDKLSNPVNMRSPALLLLAGNAIQVDISDKIASLTGNYSVIGLAFVLHDMPDDLGLGNHTDSLTTGHAGARIACGIIKAR